MIKTVAIRDEKIIKLIVAEQRRADTEDAVDEAGKLVREAVQARRKARRKGHAQ